MVEEHELEVISEVEEDEQAKSERECLLPLDAQIDEDRSHPESSIETDDGEKEKRKHYSHHTRYGRTT